MTVLTPFQVETEAALREALATTAVSLEQRIIEGERETFVRAKLGGTAAEVFIYEDGAGLQGPGLDLRFESPDYGSANELAQAFLAEVVVYARTHSKGS